MYYCPRSIPVGSVLEEAKTELEEAVGEGSVLRRHFILILIVNVDKVFCESIHCCRSGEIGFETTVKEMKVMVEERITDTVEREGKKKQFDKH
jgi:hypothetical protein